MKYYDFDVFQITIKISSLFVLMISSIYIEEPPIQMSISITQMDRTNVANYGYYTKSGVVQPNESTVNLGCTRNNLHQPNIGMIMVNIDTFKGVKFALYGTYKSG